MSTQVLEVNLDRWQIRTKLKGCGVARSKIQGDKVGCKSVHGGRMPLCDMIVVTAQDKLQ